MLNKCWQKLHEISTTSTNNERQRRFFNKLQKPEASDQHSNLTKQLTNLKMQLQTVPVEAFIIDQVYA
jgi:hypothetical protein